MYKESCADQEHGQGLYTWVDGEVFGGEFVDGKPHGVGVKSWPDGERWVMNWNPPKYQESLWFLGEYCKVFSSKLEYLISCVGAIISKGRRVLFVCEKL